MLDEAALTRPAARRRRNTREEILDAAWDLCRADGLTSLSLRELAARVGMRAPSLYSYFDSKDAIYDAMFADGQRQLVEHMAPFTKPAAITREQFRAAMSAFFRFCTDDPVRYQLLFQRTVPGFEPSGDSYALAIDALTQLADQLAAMGVDDPGHVDLWTAIVTGLTSQQISNDPGGDRWLRLLDQAVDMFCDHVSVPPE